MISFDRLHTSTMIHCSPIRKMNQVSNEKDEGNDLPTLLTSYSFHGY